MVNDYKPIEVKDLPQAVQDTIKKDFADLTICLLYTSSIFKPSKKSYLLSCLLYASTPVKRPRPRLK